MARISLDYFKESANWLSNLPVVNDKGVGVMGLSKGGTIALVMPLHIPQVKAVVNINGAPFNSSEGTIYNSKGDLPNVEFYLSNIVFSDDGAAISPCLIPRDEDFIKTWNSDVSVLYIVGEDDHCMNPEFISRFKSLVPPSQQYRYEFIKYPGAGHLIEPPYSPFCRVSYHKRIGFKLIWGGSPKEHNAAQEDSWERILRFLSRELRASDEIGYSNR